MTSLGDLLRTGLLVAGLACTACSGDDGGSGGGGDGFQVDPTIDTSDFKNTEDRRGFHRRSTEAGGVYDDMDGIELDFRASGATNPLMYTALPLDRRYKQVSDPLGLECEEVSRQEIEDFGITLTEVEELCHLRDDPSRTCTRYTIIEAEGEVRQWGCEALDPGELPDDDDGDGDFAFEAGAGYQDFFSPALEGVYDCQQAFDSFERLYQGAEQEFEAAVDMLQGGGFNLTTTSATQDRGQLSETETDERSAVAYEFSEGDGTGLEITGRIWGGANDELVVIGQSYEMTIDMLGEPSEEEHSSDEDPIEHSGDEISLPVSQSTITLKQDMAVNTERRIAEVIVSMGDRAVSETSGSDMSVSAHVVVSAGEDKYVRQSTEINFRGVGGGETSKGKATFLSEAQLIKENVIHYKMTATGHEGSGRIAFDIIRDGNLCKIEDMVNTIK